MVDLKKLKELTADLQILYVEDEISIQKTMVQYLKKFFSLVTYASDGLEGLKCYQKEKYDIVITDLSMPKMSGLEMIEQIKNINEEQAIIITTAHSESEYMFGAIKSGIDGYVIKPFDFQQLNKELFKITQKLKKFKENEEYSSHLQDMVNNKTSQLRQMIDFQSDNYDKTLFSLVEMIEQRDTYTAGHSKRVAEYSKLIAKEMNYSNEDVTILHQAGILHDIGKIATPDAVLLNPKILNDIEYKLIKEHVTVSHKILSNIPMFSSLAEIVYSHHERYDGKGYPRGLKGDEITPLAQIMIVADAFDAMTTNRIYKARKTIKEALAELESLKYKQFHPNIVDAALIALKDIVIDDTINQLPKTQLEEERFAYFYKDTITSAYNQNYLDVVLMKNSYDLVYENMDIFYIKHFSNYNKKYGWSEGNIFLDKFSQIIEDTIENILLFRVFGDDFVLISEDKVDFTKVKELLDDLVQESNLEYFIKNVNLREMKIENIQKIEKL